MGIDTAIRGRIAVIQLNFPPVNGLSAELRAGLWQSLDAAESSADIDGVVVTGTAKAFSAGADIKQFGTEAATREPRVATLISRLENFPKPVVAAISGVCMGGGLELAMGAHFRVAHAATRIGLPEVRLGLIPGAGGTQRFPRAVGVETALDMIITGRIVGAAALRDTALFDQITDDADAVDVAVAFCSAAIAANLPLKRLRDLPLSDDAAALVEVQRSKLATSRNRFPAPYACLDAIGWCIDTPFDEALQKERAAFDSLIQSRESIALRHAFAAERAAARAGDGGHTATRDTVDVGVVGAGTMGRGIAMACANAGMRVVLVDASLQAARHAMSAIRQTYEASARKGKLTETQVADRLSRITPTDDYAAVAAADLVIEAVFEDMDVKRSVFKSLDTVCKPGAILATNTSFLDINDLAHSTTRPNDFLGLHFFSPAHVMRLVEVVRGDATSQETLASALRFVKQLGKVGVVARVCDGFIVNRMGYRYTSAAFELVGLGASPQQVDRALEAFGMAMGPLRMGDLAGLDIGWATRKRKAAESDGHGQPRVAPDILCEHGRYGQKTGAGWYRYDSGSRTPLPDPVADELIDQFRLTKGVTPRPFNDEEIVERCVFALINEGARVLEEGIARRASDIDLAFLRGYGFPDHIGGPMLHADHLGAEHVVAALERIASEPGALPSWVPAPLLRKLAHERGAFNQ